MRKINLIHKLLVCEKLMKYCYMLNVYFIGLPAINVLWFWFSISDHQHTFIGIVCFATKITFVIIKMSNNIIPQWCCCWSLFELYIKFCHWGLLMTSCMVELSSSMSGPVDCSVCQLGYQATRCPRSPWVLLRVARMALTE